MPGDNKTRSDPSGGAEDTELDLAAAPRPPARPLSPQGGKRPRDTLAESLTGFADVNDDDYEELVEVDPKSYAAGDEIARGGMGRIIEGRDRRAGRPVAIKEILTDLLEAYSEDERQIMLRRFEREARITVRLQHPSIVPVYEIGRFGDSPYLAMKRVVGDPLDEVIGSASTLQERLSLLPKMIAVADALAYAHERGVIHRDLKPANVLVGAHGETVVIDWGLAKQLDIDEPERPTRSVVDSDDGLKTAIGSVFGTPLYMPPEQAHGDPTDRRADVYALGAILYHMLAGTPAYRDLDKKQRPTGILAALKAGPPTPLAELQPDIPADLLSIVEMAMAREPGHRYASAGELAADLRQFEAGKLVEVHTYTLAELLRRWVRRHRTAVLTAAVGLVILVGVGAFAFAKITASRDAEKRNARRAVFERDRAIRVFAEGGRESIARVALPDAAFSLVQAAELGSTSSGLDIMLGSIERSLTGVERIGRGMTVGVVHAPVDSRYVLLADSLGRIEIYDKHTGVREHAFDSGQPIQQARVSDDGRRVLVVSAFRLTVWSSTDGTMTLEIPCPQRGSGGAALTPDGRYILSDCQMAQVRLYHGDSGELLEVNDRILRPIGYMEVVAGALVIVSGNVIEALTIPGLEPRGPVKFSNPGSYPGVSARQLWAYAPSEAGDIELADLGSERRMVLKGSVGACDLVTMSSDAPRVICSTRRGNISYFDAEEGKELRTWRASRGPLISMEANADGSLVTTTTDDDILRVWDARSGRLRARYVGASNLQDAMFVGEDTVLAVDYRDGALLVRADSDLVADEHIEAEKVSALSFSRDGKMLWVNARQHATLVPRDPSRPAAEQSPRRLSPAYLTLAASPFGGALVIGTDGVHDVTTGKLIRAAPRIKPDAIMRGVISREGSLAALMSAEEAVVFDTGSGKELLRWSKKQPIDVISAIGLSSARNAAVLATLRGRLEVVNLATKKVEQTRDVRQTVRSMLSDPDDQRLFLSMGEDLLLDFSTLSVIKGFEGRSVSASMTADGRYIVRSFPEHLEIIDGRSGALEHLLVGFETPPIAYATGSDLLVVTTTEGMLSLWSLSTGRILHRHRLGVRVRRVAVAPDDGEFAVLRDNRAMIFRVPARTLSTDQLVDRLRAVFSARDFDDRYLVHKTEAPSWP